VALLRRGPDGDQVVPGLEVDGQPVGLEQVLPVVRRSPRRSRTCAPRGDCGYPDPLHFSRRFRVVLGCSPRAFRVNDPAATPIPAGSPLARLAALVTEP
jgi:hypothetical protein